MAALTSDRNTIKRLESLFPYPVAATTKLYAGGMVAVNGAGFAVPAADAAGLKVVGVTWVTVDNLTGAAGAVSVEVQEGGNFRFAATSITQAMVGTKMYVVDDQTFDDATGTNSIVAGILKRFISTTEGEIYIDPADNIL